MTIPHYLISGKQANQRVSLLRNVGFQNSGIKVSGDENIHEWKDITKQIQYQETQKKNSSLEQKDSTLDCSPKQDDPAEGPGIPENTDNLPFHFVDVSKLNVLVIDKNTIRDASRFKMTK